MQKELDTDILSLVRDAQAGDVSARELLIKRYTPYVMSVLSRATGRYIKAGEDDESSIGLMALNEAIDSFDPRKSPGFLGFSETVIKRRLIDYHRKSSFRRNEIPFSAISAADEQSDEREIDDAQIRASIREYSIREEEEERRAEIAEYTKRLAEFGISFKELSSISPKHEDARVSAIKAARVVSSVQAFRDHLYTRRELPLKELSEHVTVSRKTLERQRRYIIAVALIFIEGFPYLQEFVNK